MTEKNRAYTNACESVRVSEEVPSRKITFVHDIQDTLLKTSAINQVIANTCKSLEMLTNIRLPEENFLQPNACV